MGLYIKDKFRHNNNIMVILILFVFSFFSCLFFLKENKRDMLFGGRKGSFFLEILVTLLHENINYFLQ